jgi:osmotically-inducible protein OsmY
MRTDSQIHQKVLDELRWDTRVDETDVGVEVDNGVVTLSGSVTDYIKKIAAQEAAHRVDGVLDVVNHVEVCPPSTFQRSDTDIAQAVRHALEWDVVVPDTLIRSTVSQGWVTLEGEVITWHERESAERAIRGLAGVRGVVNRLEVCFPLVAAETVREEIEEALERRAQRHAKRIHVDVHDGIVKLSGSVFSYPEREAVLGAVRYTPGVRKVEDLLTLELGGG